MFYLSKTPTYRELGTAAQAAEGAPAGVPGVGAGGATPGYFGEGQPTSSRAPWYGLFPSTPAYRTAPPPPPPAPAPEADQVEMVCPEVVCPEVACPEAAMVEEEPVPEEGQVVCNAPVTIVIKRVD